TVRRETGAVPAGEPVEQDEPRGAGAAHPQGALAERPGVPHPGGGLLPDLGGGEPAAPWLVTEAGPGGRPRAHPADAPLRLRPPAGARPGDHLRLVWLACVGCFVLL